MKIGILRHDTGDGLLLCPDCQVVVAKGPNFKEKYICSKCKGEVHSPDNQWSKAIESFGTGFRHK